MIKSEELKVDEDLLNGLRENSNNAFKIAYQNYYYMVEDFVLKNSGSVRDARDLFQDVIIVLLRNIRKSNFELSKDTKLSTYIFAITKNIWYNKLKNQGKMKIVSIDSSQDVEKFSIESNKHEKIEFEKKHNLISKNFALLGEDCKKILSSYYYKKIKLKIIADEMGYTQNFIRQKKMRCMESLRKKFFSDPEFKNIEL